MFRDPSSRRRKEEHGATIPPTSTIEFARFRPWKEGQPKDIFQIQADLQCERYREHAQTGRGEPDAMPFQDPISGLHVEMGRYIVEVVGFADVPPGEDHPDWGPRIRWTLNVYDNDGDPVLDEDGRPGQLMPMTGVSIGPKSKAKPWIEAFLGRPLDATDTAAAIAKLLVGKRAYAMISDNERGYSTVVSMAPMKKGAAKKVTVPPDEEDDD